jgi:hypothetical protein
MLVGRHVGLDYTCEYQVLMSDLFLHYLQSEQITLELHQAIGTQITRKCSIRSRRH